MTRENAIKILKECRDCAFGYGSDCLVANGNDIPSDWLINEKVCEWTQK